jgi:hypothetical protein
VFWVLFTVHTWQHWHVNAYQDAYRKKWRRRAAAATLPSHHVVPGALQDLGAACSRTAHGLIMTQDIRLHLYWHCSLMHSIEPEAGSPDW